MRMVSRLVFAFGLFLALAAPCLRSLRPRPNR